MMHAPQQRKYDMSEAFDFYAAVRRDGVILRDDSFDIRAPHPGAGCYRVMDIKARDGNVWTFYLHNGDVIDTRQINS